MVAGIIWCVKGSILGGDGGDGREPVGEDGGKRESGREASGRHERQKSERALEEKEGSSSRVERKRALTGGVRRFSKEDKQVSQSLVMLSRELRKKLGEVEVEKTF